MMINQTKIYIIMININDYDLYKSSVGWCLLFFSFEYPNETLDSARKLENLYNYLKNKGNRVLSLCCA